MGNRFLRSGEIIRTDQFSWTLPGYVWGNSYFVYQILLAFLFNRYGHVTTAIVTGVLSALAVLIILPKKLDFFKFLAVGLGSVIAGFNVAAIRPHAISFLMFCFLLAMLNKKLYTKKLHSIIWFIIFAVWANFHRGFTVGLVVLTAYLLIDYIWRIVKLPRLSRKLESEALYERLLCILAGFLGTLVNPFPIDLWRSGIIFDLTSKHNLFSISEWQPVAIFPWMNIIYALSGLIFIYVFFKKFREVEPAWFLVAAFLFMLAFLVINFALFWAAIFIFITSRYLKLRISLAWHSWSALPVMASSLAVFAAFFLLFLVNLLVSSSLKTRLAIDSYPVSALVFLKENNLIFNVFNDYSWGGYIDWQAPEIKVFIDGRMASWKKGDKSILADYLAILRGKCDVAKMYDIRVVLVKSSQKVECFDNFTLEYQDSIAKVLVKQR